MSQVYQYIELYDSQHTNATVLMINSLCKPLKSWHEYYNKTKKLLYISPLKKWLNEYVLKEKIEHIGSIRELFCENQLKITYSSTHLHSLCISNIFNNDNHDEFV